MANVIDGNGTRREKVGDGAEIRWPEEVSGAEIPPAGQATIIPSLQLTSVIGNVGDVRLNSPSLLKHTVFLGFASETLNAQDSQLRGNIYPRVARKNYCLQQVCEGLRKPILGLRTRS